MMKIKFNLALVIAGLSLAVSSLWAPGLMLDIIDQNTGRPRLLLVDTEDSKNKYYNKSKSVFTISDVFHLDTEGIMQPHPMSSSLQKYALGIIGDTPETIIDIEDMKALKQHINAILFNLILINNGNLMDWAECIRKGMPCSSWMIVGLNITARLRRHAGYPQKEQTQYTLTIEDFEGQAPAKSQGANRGKSFELYQIVLSGSDDQTFPFVSKLLENFKDKKAPTTI